MFIVTDPIVFIATDPDPNDNTGPNILHRKRCYKCITKNYKFFLKLSVKNKLLLYKKKLNF